MHVEDDDCSRRQKILIRIWIQAVLTLSRINITFLYMLNSQKKDIERYIVGIFQLAYAF